MTYHDFKYVFDLYSERNPRDDDQEHDIKKVRDKFSEIADAVGIKSCLLKCKDTKSGKMVNWGAKQNQFCVPETRGDFCVELIQRYTSPEFKKIRSAEFTRVKPEVSLFLIDGFTQYLVDLGYDVPTIVFERWKMDKRLHHHTNVFKANLDSACKKLTDSIEKYEQSLSLGYEDITYLLCHMVDRVEYLQDTLESILSEYESVRSNDVLNEIMQISKDTDHSMVSQYISRAVLADRLEGTSKNSHTARFSQLYKIV